jgi:hypothetical protein
MAVYEDDVYDDVYEDDVYEDDMYEDDVFEDDMTPVHPRSLRILLVGSLYIQYRFSGVHRNISISNIES